MTLAFPSRKGAFWGHSLVLIALLCVALLAGCASTDNEITSDVSQSSASSVEASAPSGGKIPISSLDELPPHTYPLQGTASEMLQDENAMETLRKAYRADLESDLDTYLITDATTLQGKYSSLLMFEMIDGNEKQVLVLLEKIKALEDKEAARLMNGLSARAILKARRVTGKSAADKEFQDVYAQELEAAIFVLPWDVVQDRIKSGKGRAEFISENFLLGIVQANMDPAANAMGELNAELAGGIIGIRYTVDNVIPLNPIVADVYGRFIEMNKVEKINIWPGRELVLTADQAYSPVVIGVWDSGVDVSLFPGKLFVNEQEKIDGTDTDSNGFIDDVNGIAYDVDGVASSDLLHPLGDQDGKLDEVFEYMQGFTDLTSAVDSPEATSVRKLLATIPPAEVGDVMTTLSFGGLYMHGTHVAGIAARNNDFAKILVARITFDYHQQPVPMTMEKAYRLADDYAATAAYFKAHDVRVVNMSWGWSFKEIEQSLTANGIGESAQERSDMARKMINILSDGLKAAFASTPDILYISAAGNADNDVEFDLTIPSGFDVPNLMVVGAVDQAGDPTSFTSGGRNVKVYANGFQVESLVPGGQTMKMSGTSMASPNVCNLAAKLLAIDPSMTPAKVMQTIELGCEAHADDPNLLVINPVLSAKLWQ
jgi:subtilisin family serine protease